MRLKLWEKSFIISFVIIFALINVCLVGWYVFDTKKDYDDFLAKCEIEENELIGTAMQNRDMTEDAAGTEMIVRAYENGGTYFRLTGKNGVIADSLPDGTPKTMDVGRTEIEGDEYYYNTLKKDDISLIYVKSMEQIYEEQTAMTVLIAVIDLVLAAVTGMTLYFITKKLYRPVRNISHELRTPLTSILGYAQYISMRDAENKETFEAANRIRTEAVYMKELIERLLLVDSIRGGKAQKEDMRFDKLVDELRDMYPEMKFENDIKTVKADRSLVRSMLMNLIDNAVYEDQHAYFIAEGSMIKVVNRADKLTDDDVTVMNNGEGAFDEKKVKGYGIGTGICRDIAKAHGWELKYILYDGMLTARIEIR